MITWKIFQRWACAIGAHDWKRAVRYGMASNFGSRVCRRCPAVQEVKMRAVRKPKPSEPAQL